MFLGEPVWEELDRAALPDGKAMVLRRRGRDLEIVAGGLMLMSTQEHGSEEALAALGCRGLPDDATVLVGGLGLGFTLRATLDACGAAATVVQAELLPAIVAWNRGLLGPLAGHPLRDPRVELAMGDVADTLRASPGRFHAILLDVDNGPRAFTQDGNDGLYGDAGLAQIAAALRPGGVLAVWSAWPDRKFLHRLAHAGFEADDHVVPARGKKGGRDHVIFVGRLTDTRTCSPPPRRSRRG
jgi:spermidine synthase